MTKSARKIRHGYEPSVRVLQEAGGPSRTKQAFKEECDVNNIMQKHAKTGLITHVNTYGGFYADLPPEIDYQAALEEIRAAEEMFMALPSKIRTRFGNDPAQFLDYVADAANDEEMIKMGLKNKPLKAVEGAEEADKPQPGQNDLEDAIEASNAPLKDA